MNEADFRQQAQAEGFGDPQIVEFEPNLDVDMHIHDFSAFVMVTSGEFTLVTEAGSDTHLPGEVCTLAAGTLHTEKTGADGATILIGKK